MAVDPNPSIWNSDDSQEIVAINYGIGDAGTYLPLTDNFATTDVDTEYEKITLDIDIATGAGIKFTTTGGLPEPLVVGTLYYAIRVDATHIKVATTYAYAIAGTAIDLTTQGTGIHTVTIDNEYHIWNDKGAALTSSPMISVKITVRDADGYEVEPITYQHWAEIKSTIIVAGGSGGSITGYTDDNMTVFQPVGKDSYLALGDIPYDCYRVIFVRVNLPTSALQAGVTFSLYVTNQEPSSSIAKWITGLHGNGVVYQSGGAFAVSIGTPASKLDIERGFALIDSLEGYYGADQQYDVSGLDNGTYKLYLTSVGVIGTIISTSSIPLNSIELSRAVISGGECTGVTDKRNFIASVMVGLDAAKTATPTINQLYIATDTTKIYACFVDDSWTQIYPTPDGVTKTGDFTAGKVVKINNASGLVEMATNTDTDVADAVTKKHAQDTDAHLGTVDQDIPMNTHKFTGLSAPGAEGDSIRATTKITEANLEDSIDKKHEQNKDTGSDSDPFTLTGKLKKSSQIGITAHAGGGQANAVEITKDIAEISVCATEGDSVKLPAAVAGLVILVINHGIAAANVFPDTDDDINEVGANTAKSLGINASMLCTAYDDTNWECVLLNR